MSQTPKKPTRPTGRKPRAPRKPKADNAIAAPVAHAPVDKASGKPSRAPVPQPHGGALVPGAGGGRANGLLGGRPRNTTRALFRKLLREELAPAAVAVVKNSKKVGDHFEAIERFAAIGFNEKLRMAKLSADSRAQAAAAAQAGSNASVQVHLSGPPTGVERPINDVTPNQ